MNQTIKINNNYYTIEFTNAQNPSLQGGEALGLCNTTSKVIFISKDLSNKQDILRHEIVHAVLYEYLSVDITWTSEKVCEFYQRYYQIIEDLVNQVIIQEE